MLLGRQIKSQIKMHLTGEWACFLEDLDGLTRASRQGRIPLKQLEAKLSLGGSRRSQQDLDCSFMDGLPDCHNDVLKNSSDIFPMGKFSCYFPSFAGSVPCIILSSVVR